MVQVLKASGDETELLNSVHEAYYKAKDRAVLQWLLITHTKTIVLPCYGILRGSFLICRLLFVPFLQKETTVFNFLIFSNGPFSL